MHHKNTVKKTFKILFFLIQALLFISGIALLIVSTTVYMKSHELLQIPPRMLVFSHVLGVLEVMSAVFGYGSLASRRRLRMFVYISTTLILMNIQVIMAIKSSAIHEKSFAWADTRWNDLNNDQRNFVQSKFECCGLLEPSDRNGTMCPGAERSCMSVISRFSKSISTLLQRVLVFSFFVESVGVGILTMLRLRK